MKRIMKNNMKISLKRFLKTALVTTLLAMTFLGFEIVHEPFDFCAKCPLKSLKYLC